MRTLYLDCGMGAAGDMLTAALLELLPRPDEFVKRLNGLGIPGVTYHREQAEKCGITGTHITVTVDGHAEGEHDHEHDHHHEHDHEHHHHHSGMEEIGHLIGHLPVSEKVRADIRAVYDSIAQAESHVHGVPVTDIHFHEVGTMDAVADVTAVCLLMEELAADQVIASPVHVGGGTVRCAHGVLPVPAPATAYLLRDVPIYGGAIQGELCTPTGAALLRHFVTRFGDLPVMTLEAVGYGMGQKDFPRANCLRAMLGGDGGGERRRGVAGLQPGRHDRRGHRLRHGAAAGRRGTGCVHLAHWHEEVPARRDAVRPVPGGAAGGHGASAAAAHHHPGRPGDPAPAVYPVPQPGHRGLPLGPRGPENLPGLGRPAAEAGI